MEELWKDIPGYEGIYQASSKGMIRTANGKITSNRRNSKRIWKMRVLKGRGDSYSTGKRVSLWKDGRCKDWLVARLVALTFLGDPPEGYTVNHIDGNRMNNAVENLEWLSRADNIKHGFRTGLYAKSQKKIRAFDGESYLCFDSMSEFDRRIGRKPGYVSEKLKKNKPISSPDGVRYSVEIL